MGRISWVSFSGKDCSGCKHLNERGYCEFTACIIPCTVRATIPEVKPKTNSDRIRSMSDEELAEWFFSGDFPWCVYEEDVVPCTYEDIPVHPCDRCLLNWLKQEADDDLP